MRRVIIVHRWDATPQSDWYPWLKKELERKGYKVLVPRMPRTDVPKIKLWVSHLRNVVETLDTNTYFVGHSIGCQTIMRYLQAIKNPKIGGAVFVAGWFVLKNLEDKEAETIAEPWMRRNLKFSKLKKLFRGKLKVFLSSNDPYNCAKENKAAFTKKLGARVIVKKNKGHFTADTGITKLPETLRVFRT